MTPSFKQYMTLTSLTEEEIDALTEEQVDELLEVVQSTHGKFYHGVAAAAGKVVDTAKAVGTAIKKAVVGDKEELQAKRDQLKAASRKLSAKRDAEWAEYKARMENPPAKKVGTSTVTPTGRTSQAASGRAAERDWINSMTEKD